MTYHAPINLPYAHPLVKRLLAATFPTYRGRKVRVQVCDYPVDVTSYWSEGSRDYYVAINLSTMQTMSVPQNGTPFDGGPIAPKGVLIPPGRAIVRHHVSSRYCDVTIMIGPMDALAGPAQPAILALAAGA